MNVVLPSILPAADWRSRQHDDLVLALALAAFLADRTPKFFLH